jgi:hypothetical protein
MSSIILTWVQAFAAALVPSLLALALVWLRQHQVNTTVIEAVGRAAGAAYKQMVEAGAAHAGSTSLVAAVAEGQAYLSAQIPDMLKAAGLTPEAAARMVSAELGKLLAIDPTIGLGTSFTGSLGKINVGNVAGDAGVPSLANSKSSAEPAATSGQSISQIHTTEPAS